MIAGGTTTLSLILSGINLPLGLDANIYGIVAGGFHLFLFSLYGEKNSGSSSACFLILNQKYIFVPNYSMNEMSMINRS
jgi:hypothetical protein